ncbi:MAG TPA: alpha/beta hydrolase [Gammaproteobacteria bacterium]|nr:alpha/beta hydrolase [Gammaproteobacteria bacterium]
MSPRPFFRICQILGAALMAGGIACQAEDDDFTTPPGRMVSIGNYSLHIYCQGEGSPAVIIDTGLGSAAIEWLPVLEQLQHYSRTCIYDRAGYGWSEFGQLPRTSSRIANELYLLLTNADIPGPYVLVGHSFGGLNVQMFARRYPYLVAGLVLVDSSNAEQIGKLTGAMDAVNEEQTYSHGFVVHDFVARPEIPRDLSENDPAYKSLMLMSRPASRVTVADEYAHFKRSAMQVLNMATPPPIVPTVVLTRGIQEESKATNWNSITEHTWRSLQSELAYLQPRTAQLVAERSGHQIQVEQPDLIVDAAAMVIDFVRADASQADRVPGALNDAATRSTTWLPFNDATWITDRLHTSGKTCPFGCNDAQAHLSRHAGHLAGTLSPAWQRISRPDEEGHSVSKADCGLIQSSRNC